MTVARKWPFFGAKLFEAEVSLCVCEVKSLVFPTVSKCGIL